MSPLPIIMLLEDLDPRVIDTDTGELLKPVALNQTFASVGLPVTTLISSRLLGQSDTSPTMRDRVTLSTDLTYR